MPDSIAQIDDGADWGRGLPLQDPLLAEAVVDLWTVAMNTAGTAATRPRAPRDIQTARTLLDEATTTIVAMIEAGERRGARLLIELRRCAEQVGEASVAYRLRGTNTVYAALERLRAVSTEAGLLEAVPAELCRCGFDRVILTRIVGREGHIAAVHDGWDAAAGPVMLRALRDHPLRLDELPLEGEMVRRRGPLLVNWINTRAKHLHPVLARTGCRSYVAAPIMPQGRVIGFLHADAHHQRRYVDEFDRDRLWMFAEGFGHVYERRVLLDRTRALRQEVRRANTSIVAVMNEYMSAPIELTTDPDEDPTMLHWATSMFSAQDARVDALLTRREREVMALVAEGHTNARIAAMLVLSEQTVRSHVKRILRKLRASNRAEAVARWTSHGG